MKFPWRAYKQWIFDADNNHVFWPDSIKWSNADAEEIVKQVNFSTEQYKQREAALVREIEELKSLAIVEVASKVQEENKRLRSLVNRLAEKLRLLRHYDSGSHSPETVEDIIAEAGRETE